MTKRILALLLAVLLAVSCFALTACGGEEEPKENDKTQEPGEDDKTPDEDTQTPGGDEPEVTPPQVVTYTDSVVMVEDDEPYGPDLYVFISGQDDLTVTYASSNEAAFTVAEDGTITPVAPGEGKLTIVAKDKGGETTKEVAVTIRPIWNPTDPASKEVVEIMRNKDIINAPLSFYTSNYSGNKDWGDGNDPDAEPTTAGPVEIWGSDPHLQLLFVIPKEGDNTIDATVGHGTDAYNFSFQIYLREQNLEDDRTDYSKVDGRLVPWSIYGDPTLTIYRATFYENTDLVDLVEEGKTYEVVIVVYEGEEVRAWASNTMNWTDSCTKYINKALENADVVK